MDINEKSKEIQTKIEEKKNENLEKDEDFKFKLPKEIKYEKKNPDNKEKKKKNLIIIMVKNMLIGFQE